MVKIWSHQPPPPTASPNRVLMIGAFNSSRPQSLFRTLIPIKWNVSFTGKAPLYQQKLIPFDWLIVLRTVKSFQTSGDSWGRDGQAVLRCGALLGRESQITNAQIINSNQYSEGFRLRDIQLCCSKRRCWSSASPLHAANNRVFLICAAGMLIFPGVIQALGNAINMWHWVSEAPWGGHSVNPALASLPVSLHQSLNTQLKNIW